MKLLNKTALYYLIGSAIVFAIGGIVFYFFLINSFEEDVTENLVQERTEIEKQLPILDSIPVNLFKFGDPVLSSEIEPKQFFKENRVSDTTVFDKREQENVLYRQLIFCVNIKDKTYRITLTKSLVESDDLIEAITTGLAGLFVIFLLFFYLLNRMISKKIWGPFFINLEKLKEFDLVKEGALELKSSTITELKQLNEVILSMTKKMQSDYKNLKEFAENASHEIQTPLAIIKTKLELLIQSGKQNEEEMKIISSVNEAANKLSRLNQALLLLSKIENQQFNLKEKVNISDILKKQISNFNELIESKNITLSHSIPDDVIISGNPILTDILIANLITNSIKHNIEKGDICIMLNCTDLQIINSGKELLINPGDLFERFKKNDAGSESLGLGLSIVKKICDAQNIAIEYKYEEYKHKIILQWKNFS